MRPGDEVVSVRYNRLGKYVLRYSRNKKFFSRL